MAVRKRVIRIMKNYYNITNDTSRQIEICARLTLRMLDEDESVKDLAVKTIEELWFLSLPPLSVSKGRGSNEIQTRQANTNVAVIMGVSGLFKERQSPFEDLLHHIIAAAEKNTNSALHLRSVFSGICNALIDGLVDASDFPGFVSKSSLCCLRLNVFCRPSMLVFAPYI